MPENTSVEVRKGTTHINSNAFNNQKNLTSIKLPESLISIGSSAFESCSQLTSIVIPENITSIGNSTFYDCSKLTTIVIPENVTSIGHSAFSDCIGLASVTNLSLTPVSVLSSTFRNVDKNSCTLYVPECSAEAYQATDIWNEFTTVTGIDSELCNETTNVMETAFTPNKIVGYYNLMGITVRRAGKRFVYHFVG